MQAAHRGGLNGAAGTVAVLGCGLDVVYPPEHADLARAIAAAGALLSEYGPSTPSASVSLSAQKPSDQRSLRGGRCHRGNGAERGYVAYCVQKLLSRKSGHGTRLLVEVDLLTKE